VVLSQDERVVGKAPHGDGTSSGRPVVARWPGRRLPIALLVIVIALAGVLRLDALTGKYGQVSQPGWLQALQRGSQALVAALHHPAGTWTPEPEFPHRDGPPTHYRSDPYTYLQRAREMQSFYGAHFREPVFPFVVKLYLWLFGDQDVAVSLASTTFSMLCVLMAYVVGTMAFSRWVGGAAALGMAIEREVISWGVAGWRDDAYAFVVLLSVCAMFFYRRKPSIERALVLGVTAALACLTRIFAVSFLIPGFLFLLLWSPGSWRHRSRDLLIAAATMVVLVLPYLVNCWRVYGDPLYTLNYQTISYLAWEGANPATRPGAVGYIGGKLLTSPFETIDTAALGLTTYPFLNKWSGFDPWLPGLGSWLAAAALLGLVLFLASAKGRLLLVVLISAQVPFAFTWKLSWDWRYTEFTYPFFLLAAGLAITSVVGLARPSRWKHLAAHPPSPRAIAAWALTLSGIAVVAWTVLRVLPVLIFREALLEDRPGVIVAGPRDEPFFREGWSDRVRTGNVTSRIAEGEFSVVDVPLPRAADYDVTVRLDPFPPPSGDASDRPAVRVFFNDVLLRTVDLTWNPEEVGSYDLAVPRALVKRGRNRLVFMAAPGAATGAAADTGPATSGFRLWYVLVRP